MPDVPMVSVCVWTYNHAPYIREALDSVLAQQTDFAWEICIGEDDSSDGTREICREYAARHPDRIRLFLRRRADAARYGRRLLGRPNGLQTLGACRGRYVAFLEGDDYWCDPTKLQKQVSFLERHPDYAACFHNVEDRSPEGRRIRFNYVRDTFTADDFVETLICRTLSVTARKSAVWPLPTWATKTWILDYCLFWHAATHGKFRYFPEVMGVYRIHANGLWSSSTDLFRAVSGYQIYSIFRDRVSPPLRPAMDRKLMQLALWTMKHALRQKSPGWFLRCGLHAARHPLLLASALRERLARPGALAR